MASSPQPGPRKAERLLLVLFLLSLPLLNPWVRGDGVGYYAYARAPLIEHSLDFTHDYQQANSSFRENRLDKNGQPTPEFRTRTGHIENHFTVGPAILWAPFLLVTHAGVLLARAMGSAVSPDGFSTPYRIAMACGTAFYGFLGLLISFRLARKYVDETWALLATLAIWWASSLPVYMYFNPSWSHAHSAFVVALFVWCWHETRDGRTVAQWILLGALAGLMLDVYYANVMLFVILLFEAAREYSAALRQTTPSTPSVSQLLTRHAAFAVTLLVCMLPIFIAHRIVYGSIFETGYVSIRDWFWTSPYLFSVLFSSNHGLISWTPILLFAVIGLFAFWRSVPRPGWAFLGAALGFHFFVRKPFFCFANAAFYSGARRFFGSFHADIPNAPRRACSRLRFSGLLCFLECRPDVSVGHAPHPGARPNFFSANDPKPIPRCAAPDYDAVREVPVWPQSHDAADRAARPGATQAAPAFPVIIAPSCSLLVFCAALKHREARISLLIYLRDRPTPLELR